MQIYQQNIEQPNKQEIITLPPIPNQTMPIIQTLIQKIHSEFSLSQSPHSLSLNLQKLKLYLADTNKNQHQLNLSIQNNLQISKLIKNLFNPQNAIFLIQTGPPHQNYLEKQNFQTDIQHALQQFQATLQNQQNQQLIQFLPFMQFLFKSNTSITVFYQKYFDQIQKQVKDSLPQIYNHVSEQTTQKSEEKLIQNTNNPISEDPKQQPDNKISPYLQNQTKKEEQVSKKYYSPQLTDPFNYFLRKFYDHYCKKYLNTIKDQQFEKLSEFYNSMNLTKFMMYCKDMKLLKFQKTLSAKLLQQMFKTQQNQRHSLQYESFAKIIQKCLQEVFETQELIKSQGYETIGVLNRQNFIEVMGRIGVLVPLKKTFMVKSDQISHEPILVKSKSKDSIYFNKSRLMNNISIKNLQSINGHGHESNWDSNDLHPELFLNEKQRKQQLLLQSLTIPKLTKLQPSKHMDEKLQSIVDEQYDPYLRRYNQNSIHHNSSGVLKRMDERINNVVKKIR